MISKEEKMLSTIKDENQAPAIKESKAFKLKGKDTNVYNFSINLNKSHISLEAVDMNDISGAVYRNTLSLEKFYKTHKMFKFYENLKEVFDFFGELDESDISINSENNNVIVSIKCSIMKKKDEINFVLLPQEMKIEDITKNLCEKVKEIDCLKKEVDTLYGLMLGVKKSEINKFYEQLKKESEIIEGLDEFTQILNGIKRSFDFRIKNINVLFKSSKDGDASSTFHQKCDGKQFTITLVKTTNKRRFGGFKTIAWDQSGAYKPDRYAFIFSFDNKENYFVNDASGSNAIYCHSSYGPTFGDGHDFYIANGCKNNTSSYDNTQYRYYNKERKTTYGLATQKNFQVENYEVFQFEFL